MLALQPKEDQRNEKDLVNNYLDYFAGYADPGELLVVNAGFIGLVNSILGHLQFEELIVENNLYKNKVENNQPTNQEQL